jgi:hypothetical protein
MEKEGGDMKNFDDLLIKATGEYPDQDTENPYTYLLFEYIRSTTND